MALETEILSYQNGPTIYGSSQHIPSGLGRLHLDHLLVTSSRCAVELLSRIYLEDIYHKDLE